MASLGRCTLGSKLWRWNHKVIHCQSINSYLPHQYHRSFSTPASAQEFPWLNTIHPKRNCFAQLQYRGLISIEGDDTIKFLQAITTNDMKFFVPSQGNSDQDWSTKKCLYACILTVQGRVQFDVIVYQRTPAKPHLLIECDKARIEELHSHLTKIKLRAKIVLGDASSEWKVWSVMGPDATSLLPKIDKSNWLPFVDPRSPKMGLRVIGPAKEDVPVPPSFAAVSDTVYHYTRILNGISEGAVDLPPTQAIPIESNFEELNGISYTKGCYRGQELIARTHYRGQVRKRLFPVIATQDPKIDLKEEDLDVFVQEKKVGQGGVQIPPPGTVLTGVDDGNKKMGQLYSGVLNIGLAMLRLEHLEQPGLVLKASDGGVFVKPVASVPWWPTLHSTPEAETASTPQ